MSLTIGDNFSYNGAKPLDARLTYSTLAEMANKADSTLYDGIMAYCVATDKTYQWKSTNPVDPDTGRWREFSSGGGGSVTVDDELSATSTNPVQNKVIKGALDSKANTADLAAVATSNDYEDLDNLPAVPEKTSDLNNDSGFIDNTVANLVNYYTKQQTYTQAEVQALISAAVSGGFEVVESLPATGDSHTIYLMLKSPAGETGDIYDEYIYVNGAWEHIGSTSIDLTQYQTKALLNSITVGGVEQTTVEGALAAINAALASYMTTAAFNTAIADYYTKTQVESLLDDKVDWEAQNILGAKNLLEYSSETFTTGSEQSGKYTCGTAHLLPGEYVFSAYQDTALSVSITVTNSLILKRNGDADYTYENRSVYYHYQAGLHKMTFTVPAEGDYTFGYAYELRGTPVTFSQLMVRNSATSDDWLPTAPSNRQLHKALEAKQDQLTFDTAPTANSTNPVTSGGVKTALDNKQDKLTFDNVPTANSDNPVKSGGVYSVIGALSSLATSVKTSIVNAINELVNGKQDKMSAGTGISLTNDGKTINATNTLPLNYSTSEQVVGTWIDGKPLYQKTIEWTYEFPNNNSKNVPLSTLGLSGIRLIQYCGHWYFTALDGSGMFPSGERANSAHNSVYFYIWNGSLYCECNYNMAAHTDSLYVTLTYTKPTD